MPKFQTKVIETKKLTRNVFAIKLLLPSELIFKPGQYVSLILDNVKNDPKGDYRQLSIASSPTEKILLIVVRVSSSPFKQVFIDLKPGDKVTILGFFGRFILKEVANKHHVMICGGVGITPLRSMIKYAYDKKLPLKITLIYSNKTKEDIVFYNEFLDIEKNNPNFHMVNTITDIDDKSKWNGNFGRIDKKMISQIITDIEKTEFYVVGSPSFVTNITSILTNEIGAKKEQINTESFTGYT